MTDYDDLFDATAPDDSVFSDKGALDPLREPGPTNLRLGLSKYWLGSHSYRR